MKKSLAIFVAYLATCLALQAEPVVKYYNDSTETQHADLEEITITSTRINNSGTLAKQKIKSEDLQLTNTGVNLPFLLQMTPSLVATSDDGLGIGYTYFRIRGTDHTRINTTVNGVPLNDSESQTVFWVNMTDIASSTNSVEVQRGVGTSTNGAAAFGASVNMQTSKASPEPYTQLSFNGGMYNTFREEAKIGTGIMPSGFAFDARVSKVNSDGYLERAYSDLLSYYASGAWYGDQTMVKLLFFGGNETTYMAWDGVSAEDLKTNRRYNPAGQYIDDDGNIAYYDNQTDNYAQQHVQLHVTHSFNSHWDLNAALHYTHGAGYYEQYKCDAKFSAYGLDNYINDAGEEIKRSDLVRQKHLGNHFYGGVAAINYRNSQVQASLGGGANNYNGNHWGNIIWLRSAPQISQLLTLNSQLSEYYRSRGDKFDANIYIKANWKITQSLNLYGDLQYRHIDYKIKGINDEDLSELDVHKTYNFFNPKAGISYVHQGHTGYFNFAVANREPSRANFTEAGVNDIPLPERLYDYEFGYQYLHRRFGVGANFYFMDYYNQLVLTGQYSDVGAYLTKNVDRSYRMGVELTAGVEITKWLRWDVNATLSMNKIINFSDWADDWYADWDDPVVAEHGGQVLVNYGTTNISFSPNVIAGSNIQFDYKGFQANLLTNYVGKQYLDNTNNRNAMLDDYCVSNLRLAYTLNCPPVLGERAQRAEGVDSSFLTPHSSFFIKSISFHILLNNLFNTRYESNGGVYGYFEGADANGNLR
ncbi:MAG: TonB-dependent receptor, partial [Paludibacteraceae bacterium]|nr:TonB-dependent receptor [Paludibacteraceae bacterium]